MYSVNIRWRWDQKKNTPLEKVQPVNFAQEPFETTGRARAPTLLPTHQRGARSPQHEIIMRSGLFLAGSPCRGAAVNNTSLSRRRSLFNCPAPSVSALLHLSCDAALFLMDGCIPDHWLSPYPLLFIPSQKIHFRQRSPVNCSDSDSLPVLFVVFRLTAPSGFVLSPSASLHSVPIYCFAFLRFLRPRCFLLRSLHLFLNIISPLYQIKTWHSGSLQLTFY